MEQEFLTPGRVKVLRNLLYVVLGIAVVLLAIAVLLFVNDDGRGAQTVLGIGLVNGLVAWEALRSIAARSGSARRWVIMSAVVLIASSVLLVAILIGLLTVIVGVGLLAATFAPEREATA